MRALARITRVELTLFRRDPITAIFSFAFPLIVLFVLAEVFGNQPDTGDEGELVFRGVGPIDYYVPAYVALVLASLGLVSLPVHVAGYRERGVLRRLQASGASGAALAGSQLLVTLLIGAGTGAALVVAARLAYGTDSPARVAGVVGVFVLVSCTFTSIGILLGSILPTARAAQGVGLLLFFVMMFVCGAGPPPEVLSEPLRRVADVMPLTYAIRALQDPWLGLDSSGTSLVVLAGFLLASCVLATTFARRRSG